MRRTDSYYYTASFWLGQKQLKDGEHASARQSGSSEPQLGLEARDAHWSGWRY